MFASDLYDNSAEASNLTISTKNKHVDPSSESIALAFSEFESKNLLPLGYPLLAPPKDAFFGANTNDNTKNPSNNSDVQKVLDSLLDFSRFIVTASESVLKNDVDDKPESAFSFVLSLFSPNEIATLKAKLPRCFEYYNAKDPAKHEEKTLSPSNPFSFAANAHPVITSPTVQL
jgi:hypothetical protein